MPFFWLFAPIVVVSIKYFVNKLINRTLVTVVATSTILAVLCIFGCKICTVMVPIVRYYQVWDVVDRRVP